ncbi:MAG: polysaccharide biosynthesis tyrosine autokinase [Planctomycetota bacterium]
MSPEPGAAGGPDQNARLLMMLRRGRWLILAVPLLAAGATWAYFTNRIPGFHVTPLYQATAKIQVDARQQDPLEGSQPLDSRPGSLAKQQEQLFRTQVVMRPLSERPEVVELRSFQSLGGGTVLAALYNGLTARSDAKTDQVAVSFTSPSRRDAMIVADAAVEAYIGYHRQRARDKAMDSIAILEAERAKKLTAADELDARIRAAQEEHGIAGAELRNPFETNLQAFTLSCQEALKALGTGEVELERVEEAATDPQAFIDYGTGRRNESTNAVLEQNVSQFITKQAALRSEYMTKLASLNPDSQPMLDIQKQIADLQPEIDKVFLLYAEDGLREARDRVAGQRKIYETFAKKLDEVKKAYFATEDELAELRKLRAEWQLLRDDANSYSSRIADLHVSGAGGGLGIQIVEPAHAGEKPVYPETPKYVLIAAVLGFALGVGLVLLRGVADRRIWTVEEVPGLLGADVVGVFPELLTRKRPRVGRIVEEDPGSLAAEAIRSLRTSCSFGLPDNGKGIVFVTSAVSGEGKSIVASNLAIAFAQSGRRTLLVDADLRSPGQNEIFSLIGKRGFGDALAGDGQYEEGVVRSVTADGLDVLAAGDASPGAAELVEGGASRELFTRLRHDYDCVVVDSSPVLETAETRVLASLSDLVVFVMRMNVSTAPNGRRAVGILGSVGAELLGVMLNGARSRRGAKAYAGGLTYGYGSGTGYGYGYGQYKRAGGKRDAMQEVASRSSVREARSGG